MRGLLVQILKRIQVLLVYDRVHTIANCVVSLDVLVALVAIHEEVPSYHVDVFIVHLDLVLPIVDLEGKRSRGRIYVSLIDYFT